MAFHDSVACPQIRPLLDAMKGGLHADMIHVAEIGSRLGLCAFQRRGGAPGTPGRPELPPYELPPATLLFHFAPWRERPEMIDFHLRQLEQYLPQFSKVRMSIVTGQDFAHPNYLEPRVRAAAAPGADVAFFHIAHAANPFGETAPFFRHLLPTVQAGEHVCYAHSKGAILTPMPRGRWWAELMYRHTLGNTRAMIALLQKHPCAGPFIIHPTKHRHAEWVYGGTFFWFHGSNHTRSRSQHSRYAVESWLGEHIPLRDACCILSRTDLKRFRADAVSRYLALPWEP